MSLPPCPLLQALLSPLLASILALLLGRRLASRTGWLVGPVLAYQTGLLALVALRVWRGAVLTERYGWLPGIPVALELVADGLSAPVALVMSLICTCLAFYSVRYIEYRVQAIYGPAGLREGEHFTLYYALYPLFPIGLVGMALSYDLVLLWLFMELMLLPFYFIIAHLGYGDRHRIALMFFIWGTAAASLFMAGASLAYAQVGSFSLRDLPGLPDGPLGRLACLLMALGLLTKMAAFGLHVWLPWVHANTPTSLAGILACYANIGAYLLARTVVIPLPAFFGPLRLPIMVWALITMVYGALLALAQEDVKFLCACSTMSQIAYSLLGVASMGSLALAGGLFYMLSHCLGKAVLFSTAGLLVYETHERDMRKMGGLASLVPATATFWALGSMILSAVPPLSGFTAELMLFMGIFKSTEGSLALSVAILGVLATALTAAYTFWPLKRMFFGPLKEGLEHVREAPRSMLVPLALLALASMALGLWPGLVMSFFLRSA